MMKRKYEIIFIFGFTALFLCGIGDWLIGYEPPGGTPLIFGISSTSIADVPVWFYIRVWMHGFWPCNGGSSGEKRYFPGNKDVQAIPFWHEIRAFDVCLFPCGMLYCAAADSGVPACRAGCEDSE